MSPLTALERAACDGIELMAKASARKQTNPFDLLLAVAKAAPVEPYTGFAACEAELLALDAAFPGWRDW